VSPRHAAASLCLSLAVRAPPLLRRLSAPVTSPTRVGDSVSRELSVYADVAAQDESRKQETIAVFRIVTPSETGGKIAALFDAAYFSGGWIWARHGRR